MARVRWGLLSTAAIGRTVVAANPGAFVAVASRDRSKAEAWAAATGLAAAFGSYEEATTSEALMRAATSGQPETPH